MNPDTLTKYPLKNILEEEADCRVAFTAYPEPKYLWCCHPMQLVDLRDYSVTERITYIREHKSLVEQARRLRNFRPVLVELPKNIMAALETNKQAEEATQIADLQYQEARSLLVGAGYGGKDTAQLAKDNVEKCFYERQRVLYAYDDVYRAWLCTLALHDKELRALHDQDWPDNTWGRIDIFD